MNKEEMKDMTQRLTKPESWGYISKTQLTLTKRHLTE